MISYNVAKLCLELRAAGITTHGNCNSDGKVWSEDNKSFIQSRNDVVDILSKHNPNPSVSELATIARKANAVNEAKRATELRTLTATEAVAYVENNVTTLATAKTVIKIMVRLLIALRDETWTDLPE